MPLLLSCQALAKSFHRRDLFAGITLGIYDGERIGLIGPNGSGKSTFLKLLAGLETPDSGDITRRRDIRVGYVPQSDAFPAGATAGAVLAEALAGDHLEEHDRTTRVNIMLTRLGFPGPDVPADTLSGGWRKRLAIARELVSKPDLLLLDEPTNHLDLEGILWLERLLQDPRDGAFAALVVSHDRYFLDNMTTRIIEINRVFPDGFYCVPGVYSDFLSRRDEFLRAQSAQQDSLENRVRREVEWLKRGPKAQRTKNKSRIEDAHRKIDQLSDLKSRHAASCAVSKIEFAATQRKTNKLLAAHNLAKSLGGKTLFSSLHLVLTPHLRVGVLGPNGSGKTTLLRTLAGEIPPDSGTLKRAPDLRVVFFDQARASVEKDLTLRQALWAKSDTVIYRDQPLHINTWAKRFLFSFDQLNQPVSTLSGGEQARILIARLMLQPADILILDEPTNDLDIPSLEVLEESLAEFAGAIVLVTHDRFMLDRLCSELLALDGEGHAGIYSDLAQWERAAEARRAKSRSAAAPAPDSPPALRAAAPETPPRRRKLTYMEQKDLDTIEARILAAEADVERLQQEVEGCLADPLKLDAVCRELHDAQQLVAQLYARWQDLESKRGG